MKNDTSDSNDSDGYEDFLYSKRIILIDKDFDDSSCSNWIQKLIALDLFSQERIILLINSDGGDVPAALGLIDIMRACKSEIYTVCVGMAASCAANLLVAGDRRIATQNSTIMVHQVYKTLEDIRSGDIQHEAKELSRLQNIFLDLYIEKTGLGKTKIKNMHKRDTYLSAEQAKKLNIIDEIGWNIHDWIA